MDPKLYVADNLLVRKMGGGGGVEPKRFREWLIELFVTWGKTVAGTCVL